MRGRVADAMEAPAFGSFFFSPFFSLPFFLHPHDRRCHRPFLASSSSPPSRIDGLMKLHLIGFPLSPLLPLLLSHKLCPYGALPSAFLAD